MVDLKHSTYITKAKGSVALRKALLVGDVKAIAEHFNKSYSQTHAILCGKYAGDKNIVECAERIVAFYNKVGLDDNITKIITSYGSTN